MKKLFSLLTLALLTTSAWAANTYVKVTSADQLETGKKYIRWTGYRSGQRIETPEMIREKHADRLVREAVWGMMPKGRLGRAQYAKLKVYVGAEHPHAAQKPEPVK